MNIYLADTPQKISMCWDVVEALRPHLSATDFVPLIETMQQEGYHLAFVEAEDRKSVV